ncbi:response regulator transcription factor [Bradyrhizobium sp.]|uniref:response regulator transcription factor n=1 Tax=Bradyrhizobium sp. TaxID=376 RepID=UPI000A4B7201|nr:response regulator transcription factor [Bradyrhizobium sp.]
MSVPFPKMVFIIDAMAFRRARLERFLKSWAESEDIELISLQPEEAHARLVEHDCQMMIFSAGGPSSSAHEILAEIQVLRTLRPKAALAVVSDDESPSSVVSALNYGARGYFSNSMDPDLALQALSFVLKGGTYYPPTILTGHATGGVPTVEFTHHDFLRDVPRPQSPPSSAQQGQVSIAGHAESFLQQQGSLYGEREVIQPRRRSAGMQCPSELTSDLTERQQAVLSCLCLGDPNKVIGRKLGMTETTVKVHVREIMRKLGVCNRTQVAIAAGRNGIVPDAEPEPVSENPAATIKYFVPHH